MIMFLLRVAIIVVYYYEVGLAYNLKCSDPSQWRKRAKEKCQVENQYHCILDTNRNITREFCLKPDFLPEGFRSTYSGNRDAESCFSQRFAPFVSRTSDMYDCVYQKSSCAGEGQIVFDRGSSIDDVTCRCNFRRGYGFLVKPRQKCYCNPRTEDCSCYHQPCAMGYILSTDYVCVRENSKDVVSTCPDIISISDENEENSQHRPDTGVIAVPQLKIYSDSASYAVILSMLLCSILVFGFVFVWKQRRKRYQKLDEKASVQRTVGGLTQKFVDIPDNISDISFIPKLEQILEEKCLLILKGRKGTGKSTIAKYIHHQYLKEGYKIISASRSEEVKKFFCEDEKCPCLIIFDDIFDHPNYFEIFKSAMGQQILDMKEGKITIVVATMEQYLHDNDNSKYLESIATERNVVFDLDGDESYTISDKEKVLRFHIAKHGVDFIEKVSDSNDTTLFDQILQEETFTGFPLMCALFCSHKDHLKLGIQYFRQPPPFLITYVDEIRKHGAKDDTKACQYCILVNTLLSEINIKNPDVTIKIEKSAKEWFGTANRYSLEFIQKQCQELSPNFIYVDKNSKLQFSHPVVYRAVMLSHFKICSEEIMKKCSILDVLPFLRPNDYQPLQGEVIFTRNISYDTEFAKQVTELLLENKATVATTIAFLQKSTETFGGLDFLILIEEELKRQLPENISAMSLFFRTVGQYTRKHALRCKKMEMYTSSLAWEYLCSKSCGQLSDDLIQEIIHHDSIHQILQTRIDRFGNGLLHYYMIWDDQHERQIYLELLTKLVEETKNGQSIANAVKLLKSRNCKKHTAIHFAAYLGRYNFLLNLKNVLKSRKMKALGKPTDFSHLIDKSKIKALVEKGQNHANQLLNDFSLDTLKISFDIEKHRSGPPINFASNEDYEKIKEMLKEKA